MADKSRFEPELTGAEIDALVDNTTLREHQRRVVDAGVLVKQLFYSGLLDIK